MALFECAPMWIEPMASDIEDLHINLYSTSTVKSLSSVSYIEQKGCATYEIITIK